MRLNVFDLHADTANELSGHGWHEPAGLRSNKCNIDLERAKKLDGYAQCFACFTSDHTEGLFEEKQNAVLDAIRENRDMIVQAFSARDVEENFEKGIMSAVLTIEGTCGFNCDASRLEGFKQKGFLITSLGWNEKNMLTGSNATGGGLTDKGKEYVREAQRLKMAIDVSHISDEGFWDIISITEKPIFATHSNSRSVCEHPRNITDDMFRAIRETGGVVGINLYPAFVGKNTLDGVCDHVLRFLEMDKELKHVALGGDLDGVEELPEDFSGIDDYPRLALALKKRGLTDGELERLFAKNAIRALKMCEE